MNQISGLLALGVVVEGAMRHHGGAPGIAPSERLLSGEDVSLALVLGKPTAGLGDLLFDFGTLGGVGIAGQVALAVDQGLAVLHGETVAFVDARQIVGCAARDVVGGEHQAA